MTVPANGNTVPAGSYMVFLVDSAGVPSKARDGAHRPRRGQHAQRDLDESSQYASQYPAWKGYDGDTSAIGPHTKNQAEPWWQVDYGRSRQLTSITIHNRTDTHHRSASACARPGCSRPTSRSRSTSVSRDPRTGGRDGEAAAEHRRVHGDRIVRPLRALRADAAAAHGLPALQGARADLSARRSARSSH